MRLNYGTLALLLSATVLASTSAVTGCAGSSLVYDSDLHDYHQWNRDENRYYRQWEIGTHRDHMAFERRNAGDRRAYWSWRHR